MKRSIFGSVAAVLLCVSAVFSLPVGAKELPEHTGTHFYAITYCGELAGVLWIADGKVHLWRSAQINSQAKLDKIMAARRAAEKNGTAYEVDVSKEAECPTI